MSATFFKIKKREAGTTLVEMVIYLGLLVLVVGIIIEMLIASSGVYRNLKLSRDLESSGTIAMESVLREIRNASGVRTGDSILGSSPGALYLSGTDEDSNPYDIAFTVDSGALKISKNGETPVSLTSFPVSVNYLLFTRLTSVNSEAVRVELELSGSAGGISKSEHFYGFAVLRGSY
jgi:Tfp pilus assembly protein PilW